MELIVHPMTGFCKVFQLGGGVARFWQYHHGDMSINKAIISMARDYPGSNNYPLLLHNGQVGSRERRGKDHGSPRYVGVALNGEIVNTLFNKMDTPNLNRQLVDGTVVEPEYFISTIPLCVLELQTSVSYGWCLNCYPRDISHVCRRLLDIAEGKDVASTHLPLAKVGMFSDKAETKEMANGEGIYMRGSYEIRDNTTVVIRDLPLTYNPKNYENMIRNKEGVTDVRGYSTDFINIEVDFKSSVLNELVEKKRLESFLKLTAVMKEHLNFINEKGVIEHFDNIHDILARSVALNRKKYSDRIDREVLILTWTLKREENIIDFIERDLFEKIKRKSREEITEALKQESIDAINNTALNTESKYNNRELKRLLESKTKQSYEYILAIKVYEASRSDIEKREAYIQTIKKRLEELKKTSREKPFKGYSMYRKDVIDTKDGLLGFVAKLEQTKRES